MMESLSMTKKTVTTMMIRYSTKIF
ncbi:hypothetical protein QR98_0014090 [Sarcoptes scabiei]|uniref:Uncharacterized protein n=1 Tax=Sarcoptes scabiei TaxID=52283 RepID=A0A131ZVY3_SARSC|nr:hypothetical protein QR98_0014090 [Sarcoptes scabiei]